MQLHTPYRNVCREDAEINLAENMYFRRLNVLCSEKTRRSLIEAKSGRRLYEKIETARGGISSAL